MRWERSGCTGGFLSSVAFSICSSQYVAGLSSSHTNFSVFCKGPWGASIIIIIIIIMSCREHGYPWPSHATSPYRSSPLACLQGYIPYRHIAAECMFEQVVLLLSGHMWGSIGVHHLWARPCFSSSVLHVWLSNLDSFRDGRQVAVQLVPCGLLPPGLVQYCSQHSCVIAV